MNRLLTGAGLVAVALFLIFIAPDAIFLLAAITMSALCYREFAGLAVAHGIRNPGVGGLIAGLALILGPYLGHSMAGTLAGISFLTILLLVAALRFDDLRAILPQVSAALFGAIYTFAPWRFSIDLRHVSVHLLFFALSLSWVGDTSAYYAGRLWGRHKLAPAISPAKSWEGFVASIAGSTLFGILYLHFFLPGLASWQVSLLAVAGNIAGQIGDLAESAMKRGAGVKDSGTLLPGHGGMLDRVDSSLFALPVVYMIYGLLRVGG